jgi:hypothetical protein
MVPQLRPVESLMQSVAAVPGTQQVLFRRHEDEGQSAPTTHSTQVRVCESQAGVGAAQSEFCVQATHCLVVASHAGVGGWQWVVLTHATHVPRVASQAGVGALQSPSDAHRGHSAGRSR